MLDNWLFYLVVVAVLVVAVVFFYAGPKIAAVVGAFLAAALLYIAGRKGQRTEIENEVAREELKDEIARTDAERRADAAADRVRLDNAGSPDRVRNHDPFERR